MYGFGGDGDDVFDTDRDLDTASMAYGQLYGGAGNDKMNLIETTTKMYGSGDDGDDKITYFATMGTTVVTGDDGSDIIYGRDGYGMGIPKIYGDWNQSDIILDPELAGIGGDDKIYGGNGEPDAPKVGTFQYSGGAGSDLISIGSDLLGPVYVTGDNYALPMGIRTEDATALN